MMQTGEIYNLEISIRNQQMRLYFDVNEYKEYQISSSRFGIGYEVDSYKTPIGNFEIKRMVGAGEPLGTVFKGRSVCGIHDFDCKIDEDLILTRILWLNGLDNLNSNTFDRYIYIHGTNHEKELGKPASMGCIRMSNRDILEVYELLSIGDKVLITE